MSFRIFLMQCQAACVAGLLCLLLAAPDLHSQTPSDQTSETRYWAGIITERWPKQESGTVYLVPRVEVVDGATVIRYEKQSTPPLRIRRVMVDSPASRAGLQILDTIVSFNQAPAADHSELVSAIQANGEEPAVVRIIRGNEELTVTIQPVRRPADYSDRVRQDRAAEQAELESQASAEAKPPQLEVVALPGNLPGLLALAAQQNALPAPAGSDPASDPSSNPAIPPTQGTDQTAPQKQEVGPVGATAPKLEFPKDVNFDRSTRLLIEKLEQFSLEWQELLERQKQSLKNLSEKL
jgi:hypothetical protein